DRALVPRKEGRECLDLFAVARLRDAGRLGHAGPGAPADVVVEAGPASPCALIEERVRAGADGEDAGQRVEGLSDRIRVAERPEVPDSLALGAPQNPGSRPALTHRERQVRIGLVVPVAN